MKYILLLLMFSSLMSAQKSFIIPEMLNDIKDKKIVALGDARHTDYTFSQIRYQIIKELIEKHNFNIVALESNLFEVYNSFQTYMINDEIEDVENSIYTIMRNNQLNILFNYIKKRNEQGNQIKVVGFDPQFSATNSNKSITKIIDSNFNENWFKSHNLIKKKVIKSLDIILTTNLRALLRNKKDYYVVSNFITHYLNSNQKIENDFLNQSLINLKELVDNKIKGTNTDNLRDELMYKNIVFLKDKFPNEKIVLYGSSTHFIKSPQDIESAFMNKERITLGSILTKEFKDQYFFIAATSISGHAKGFMKIKHKLKKPINNSIEKTVADGLNNNLYLSKYKDKSILKQHIYSRFLGHKFQKMLLINVIDGLLLIENNN